jgi:hypothetical protein
MSVAYSYNDCLTPLLLALLRKEPLEIAFSVQHSLLVKKFLTKRERKDQRRA